MTLLGEVGGVRIDPDLDFLLRFSSSANESPLSSEEEWLISLFFVEEEEGKAGSLPVLSLLSPSEPEDLLSAFELVGLLQAKE